MAAAKQVGLKLDPDLLELATMVAQASKQSFKDFVTLAVQREIERRLSGRHGKKLRAALDAIREYQESLGGENSDKAA